MMLHAASQSATRHRPSPRRQVASACDLVEAVRRIGARSKPDMAELERALGHFVEDAHIPSPTTWSNTTGRYTRVLLNSPEDPFQIIVIFWPPGARSAIHDHADTLGAVVTLFGEVRETKYAVREVGRDEVALIPSGATALARGSFSPITPEDGMQLHAMVNDSYTWAATMHVYLRPIRDFHVYCANAEGLFDRSRRELWVDYDHGAQTWDRQADGHEMGAAEGELAASGSCACGALCFEMAGAPALQLRCYCRDCQKSTGSVMAPLAFYPTEALRFTKGHTKAFRRRNDSGYQVTKTFCPCCGTTVLHASESHPHLVGVPVGVLDDATNFRPTTNIYIGSAPPWAKVATTHAPPLQLGSEADIR